MKAPTTWTLLAVGAIILLFGRREMVGMTRGIRNRNPGNLRYSRLWPGLTGKDDHGFAIFRTMFDGLYALLGTASAYPVWFGVRTLREFGLKWSPPSDNAGDADYGTRLGKMMEMDPDQPFDFESPSMLHKLARAIVRNENGTTMLLLINEHDIEDASVAIASGYVLPPKA